MSFRVHILGCGSATPTLRHAPSSQVIETQGGTYMIDCGEGTQMQLRRNRLSFQQLKAVFISHTHGDHCLGLVPMLSSYALVGRTRLLHLFAPAHYQQLFQVEMEAYCPVPGFEIIFHGIDTKQHALIYEDNSMMVTTLPLEHRVPCCGFLFQQKPKLPHIRRDMIDILNIPVSQINTIKNGAGWTEENGTFYSHEQLTKPAEPPKAYAYCADTKYIPHLADWIQEVDLLYHEATYADDHELNAERYYHSTARQAAKIAVQANAKQLMLGHFSARYTNDNVLLNEACEIFPNTMLADENMIVDV